MTVTTVTTVTTESTCTPFPAAGAALWPRALPAARCAVWLDGLEARYAAVRRTLADGRSEPGFVAESSSWRLAAVPQIDPAALLGRHLDRALLDEIERRLGGRCACNLDAAWVRRQYAARHAPPRHHPHGWHQDGALRFDFTAADAPLDGPLAVLPMLTCWIALTPCGVDAPGLELLHCSPRGLLAPAQLAADAIDERSAGMLRWRPLLKAGDALLFGGEVLHRTHLAPTMTADRTSLELRFFRVDALPSRLAGDCCLVLPRRRPAHRVRS